MSKEPDKESSDAGKQSSDAGEAKPLADRLSDSVLDEARSLGIHAEDINEFSSQEDFMRTLRMTRSVAHTSKQEQVQEEDIGQEEGQEEEFTWEDPELPDDLDDQVKKAITGTNTQTKKVLEELLRERKETQKTLQQLQKSIQDDRAQGAMRQMDNLLDNMGHKEVFGDTDERVTETQQANRDGVLEYVATLASGYSARGQRVPGWKALLQQAVRALHPEVQSSKAKGEADRQQRKLQDRAVFHDGGDGGSDREPARSAKAAAAVANEGYRRHGLL